MRLFDAARDRRPVWTGSKALVPIPPGTCPVDGSALVQEESGQAPLLRGGGYGAMTATTISWCPECRWTLVRERQEVRPP